LHFYGKIKDATENMYVYQYLTINFIFDGSMVTVNLRRR